IRTNLLRLFIYFVLSTLVLPSLWLSSLEGIVNLLVSPSIQQHIFPSNGAFFISLILQYALIGNMLDLLRIGDIIRYLWKSKNAITESEKREALEVTFNLD